MAVSSYFQGSEEHQGTVFSIVDKQLSQYQFYHDFLQGKLSRQDFIGHIEEITDELAQRGIRENWLNHMRRITSDAKASVTAMVRQLKAAGFASEGEAIDEDAFDRYKEKIDASFDHNRLTTYIFPEEERIAYALSFMLKPKFGFVAGGYYGYWAAWLLPGIQATGGRCVLADPEEEVTGLANRNIRALGYEATAEAVRTDAVRWLEDFHGSLDLLMIDATGDHQDPRPEYRGKAVYGPIVKAALPHLGAGSAILAHNIDRNDGSLQPFFNVIDAVCSVKIELPTVCGASVYILR